MDDAAGDAPQLRAQLEELRRAAQTRAELRSANTHEAVTTLRAAIASGRVKLKADIKKSSAFVKKLKLLTEHGADALVKDAQEINLTRYVSECVAALVEAPLKMVDLPSAVRVASLLHQRYAEFAALLEQTLLAAFDASYGTDDKQKLVKRRILLRLLTDLYLAGVFTDVHVIATIVQRVARREGGPNQGKRSGGGSSGSSATRGNMSVAGGASSASAGQLEVPLLVSFAKSVGVEFLGVLPKKYKEIQAAHGDEFNTAIASQLELVPASVQAHCLECFQEAYDLISKLYLSQHASLVKLQKRNDREEINRGEITEQHVQELEHAKQFFEKLQTSVNALADALDKDVPPLPEERNDDELLGAGISLWEGGEGGRSELHADSPFDDEDTRSFYEDLPDLLELVPAVVLGLSEADRAELKKKKEAAQSAAQVDAAKEEAEGDDAAADRDVEDTVTELPVDGPEGEGDEEEDAEKDERATAAGEDAPAGKSVDGSSSTSTAATGYHHQHDAFFATLEDLVNRDRCDKAAIDFCYRNSKANRNRLVKTLFNVPRTHLELLSYYARLVATLQSVLKDDIGTELVDLLFDEFNYHIKKRNQFRLESKIKNIRFIAELVKFGVCHPSFAFRCLKRCFSDFQGHNVYVATALLENCGRFLYCSKNTHTRMAHFLAVMMKLKSAKHLDAQAETLVENAYYMCRPPERVERAQKQYDPKYLYLLKLLYEDLDERNAGKIVKTLRKFPWGNDRKVCDMVVKAALKVTKGRVMHMKWVCDVIKGLSRYHDDVPILLVDETLEAIRHGLDLNDYRDHQVNLGFVKLLGELFNAGLVNVSVVLDVLYLIINHSHDLLSLPQYGGSGSGGAASGTPAQSSSTAGSATPVTLPQAQIDEFKHQCKLVPDLRFDPRVPSSADGPTDVFRIRLACALIEACNSATSAAAAATSTATNNTNASAASSADRGISKSRLGRFMTFFQRYVFTKTEIPLETDFVVLDLLDALTISLKDHFHRYETWEQADEAVTKILREDLEVAERKWAKQKAATAGAASGAATSLASAIPEDEEFGEDDEESDDDEDDEDDDDEEDDDETVRAKGGVDGEEDEDEEDDDDEDDEEEEDDEDEEEDEEEEEEEEKLVVHDRIQKTEEDEDFEKAFKAMMTGGADARKVPGRVNVDKMAIPTVIKAATVPPPTSLLAGDGGDARGSGDTMSTDASPFAGGVVFRMLRRGNKGKVEARHLVVPEGTSLAQHSQRQENAGKKEQSELKRLVLQNIEREDFFASANDLSPTGDMDSMAAWPALGTAAPRATNPRAAALAGPRSSHSNQRPQLTQQQLQQQKQEREAQRAGYGVNADWNNDEFGLRRGRTYRGTK